MAEYWKSAARYWCKQCKVYIRDTAFEKSQHEASGKHQGNLKRFLRDIHRGNERQQRDAQRAENEVERLRRTVAGDAKEGDTPPWKRAPPAPKPAERQVSLDERKKQMAQLAEMGVAIPEEFRGDMSLTGEWQTVSEKVVGTDDAENLTKSIGVRKRKHEGNEEDEENESEKLVSKGWGSTTRQYPGAQEEDEDLDALLQSTKDIKKPKTSTSEGVTGESDKDSSLPVKSEEDDEAAVKTEESEEVKKEESSEAAPSSAPATKADAEDATPGVVFKKRKPKAMRK